MTRRAITAGTLVIPCTANKSCSRMAEGTIQSSRYMIRRHTRGCNAVTRSTVVHDTGMIEYRAGEGTGRMTDTTVLIG